MQQLSSCGSGGVALCRAHQSPRHLGRGSQPPPPKKKLKTKTEQKTTNTQKIITKKSRVNKTAIELALEVALTSTFAKNLSAWIGGTRMIFFVIFCVIILKSASEIAHEQ